MDISAIKEILAEEGYRPSLDDDGDITFKYQGYNILIMPDEDDKLYLRFVLPNFWPIESEVEREQAVEVSVKVTRRVKAAKVFPVKDQMWATVEIFLSSEKCLKDVLDRILSVLRASVEAFSEEMRAFSEIEDEG